MPRPSPTHPNILKYSKPPTWEEISWVIKKLGVTQSVFEKSVGLRRNGLAQTAMGYRPFPVKFWHIIYENLDDYKPKKTEPQKQQVVETQTKGQRARLDPIVASLMRHRTGDSEG